MSTDGRGIHQGEHRGLWPRPPFTFASLEPLHQQTESASDEYESSSDESDSSFTESDSSSYIPATTLHQFEKLSIEIRLMIWKLAALNIDVRIVHIKQKRLKEPEGKWWERVRSDLLTSPRFFGVYKSDVCIGMSVKHGHNYSFNDLMEEAQIKRAKSERILLLGAKECGDGDEISTRVYKVEDFLDDEGDEDYTYKGEADDYNEAEEFETDSDGSDSEDSDEADPDVPRTPHRNTMILPRIPPLSITDGVKRPKALWGFRTECQTPALLLTCPESRSEALKIYKPAFSSLGATAQVYINFAKDSLYIDHNSFFGHYAELPALISDYLLPCDMAAVEEVAVENVSAYVNGEYGEWDGDIGRNENWLFDTIIQFPNIELVTDIGEHVTYGLQPGDDKIYHDLKELDCDWSGSDIFGRPDCQEAHPRRLDFYINNLRVSRTLGDWDRLFQRQIQETVFLSELDDIYEAWKEKNPNSTRPEISLGDNGWMHIILAQVERQLLNDAAQFDLEFNRGKKISYYNDKTQEYEDRIPRRFFIEE